GPAEMAKVEQAYEDKYHESFRGNIMNKLGSGDRAQAERLLAANESADSQLAETARAEETANSGIYVPQSTASVADDALNRLDNGVGSANSKHQVVDMDAFAKQRDEVNPATDNQIAAKAAPIDTVVTATTMTAGVVAVGALTFFSGGTDLVALAAITGAMG